MYICIYIYVYEFYVFNTLNQLNNRYSRLAMA